ncbi:MAG: OsmC family protein [Elusimicrobia bacterium]|nr:OsmC family protein [Elusimicrobiota bacterium]
MSVETDVVYQGGLHCLSTHGPSKATIVTDAPVDNGGKGEAFSPTDLVAAAMGSCILTIIGLLAQRGGLDISGARVKVSKEMASGGVRRIGKLSAVVSMPAGRTYSEADRRKLEQGAAGCPVKQSLHPDVQVEISYVWPG